MDFYESDQYDYEIFCSCNGSAADFLAFPKWKTAFKRMAVRPPATMPLSLIRRIRRLFPSRPFPTLFTIVTICSNFLCCFCEKSHCCGRFVRL